MMYLAVFVLLATLVETQAAELQAYDRELVCDVPHEDRVLCPFNLGESACEAVGCCFQDHKCFRPKELICECFDPNFDDLTPCRKHSDTGCTPFTGDCGLGSRIITLDCDHAPKEIFELKCCIKCERPGLHGQGVCNCEDVYPICIH